MHRVLLNQSYWPRGAAEGLGLISLSSDLGLSFKVRMHIDAAAALGIIERRGVGRVRHLDVGTLWLQEQQLRNVIELRKVAGLENPSDLLTKHLTQEGIEHYSSLIGYTYVKGRASATAGLHFMNNSANEALIDQTPACPNGPNRCYGCGRGFRSQNRLHTIWLVESAEMRS